MAIPAPRTEPGGQVKTTEPGWCEPIVAMVCLWSLTAGPSWHSGQPAPSPEIRSQSTRRPLLSISETSSLYQELPQVYEYTRDELDVLNRSVCLDCKATAPVRC